jgi:hypothetical protein
VGITRKFLSMGTGGLVDFRSDKERTARNTARGARAARQAAFEARRQTALLAEQTRLLVQEQAVHAATPVRPAAPPPVAPAGWFPDPLDLAQSRYWDGGRWTEHVANGRSVFRDVD